LKLIERGIAAKTKSSQVLKRSSKGCIRMYKISITFIGIFLFPIVSLSQEVDLQKVAVLRKDIAVNIQYLVSVPQEEPPVEGWPLMLFLHGLGECGSDINRVKKHGPPKLIENGKKFPFVVVSPQCPRGSRWEPWELTVLLDDVIENNDIDEGRIYLTGLSMGGFGTWDLAAYSPNRFAAIAPICGGGNTLDAKLLIHLPVWVFHGAEDKVVPAFFSESMVAAIQKAGGRPKITIYPHACHDCWTKTYENPELYTWMLNKRCRKKSEK